MPLVGNCIGNDGAVSRDFDYSTVNACTGNIFKHSFYTALRISNAYNTEKQDTEQQTHSQNFFIPTPEEYNRLDEAATVLR